MAAALKDAKDATVELIESSGGIFDVEIDGQLIYSKHRTGRFPTAEEILSQI